MRWVSSGSDAMLYDVVIWYEGPTDKLYLDKWLELYSREIRIDRSNIGLMHFGGVGNLVHINPGIIKKITRNSIFVIDSDRTAEGNDLHGKTRSFTEECAQNNIPCWVTMRRAVENYVPLELLKKVCNITDDALQINAYDNVLEKLGKSTDFKIKLALGTMRLMTSELLKKDTAFETELSTQLLEVINSFCNNSS